ncbi:MAG: GMP synthase [Cyclobacteriaceae bacterium]
MNVEGDKLKLAILDMNNGHPNQGMRCIRELASRYLDHVTISEYDVRVTNEVPDTDHDIYISSGGPGNPLEGNGIWENRFYDLVDNLWAHNLSSELPKKHFFFICHSFQLACNHFDLGEIAERKSTSFGVYPVHKTKAGKSDRILNRLNDPYYAVDSRDWQLIQPNLNVFKEHGAQILSLEKIRTHVEYERAIMAVRFSDEMVGTQFHPEADAEGMKAHFSKEENREKVIRNFGKRKYNNMMAHLDDPDKIALTHSAILPTFIETSIKKINQAKLQTVV